MQIKQGAIDAMGFDPGKREQLEYHPRMFFIQDKTLFFNKIRTK